MILILTSTTPMMMIGGPHTGQLSRQGRCSIQRCGRAGAASLQCPSDWKCRVSHLRPGGIPQLKSSMSLTVHSLGLFTEREGENN